MKTARSSLILAAVGTLLAVLVLLSDSRGRSLTSQDRPWTVTGRFTPSGVYPSTVFDPAADRAGLQLWGSWSGADSNTGELRSPVFRAPSLLGFFAAGYPDKPRNHFFLERQKDGARLPLLVRTGFEPRETWRELYWRVPFSWVDNQVRLVAIDDDTGPAGWIGVGTPRSVSWLGLVRKQLPNLVDILFFPLVLFLFLLPGLAVTALIVNRRELYVPYRLTLTLVASAAVGYLAFWMYFAGTTVGQGFSLAILLMSAGILVWFLWRKPRFLHTAFGGIARPLAYATLAGLLYLSLLLLFGQNTAHVGDPFQPGTDLANIRFFNDDRSIDNHLPLILAERIYRKQPVNPFCCGWLSSDRPPLQSGIFLLQRMFPVPAAVGLHYQLVGTALQSLWICGVWILLRALRSSERRIKQAMGFLIFSGFCFYNTVYVWPKFLAAALILFVISILFEVLSQARKAGRLEVILAALALGLALMAHPGSVFSLPVVGLVFVLAGGRLTRADLVLGVTILAVCLAPWVAYQKFYDPPGDRLLKMHLAGVGGLDSRTFPRALIEEYGKRDAATIASFKWDNIATLIGPSPWAGFGVDGETTTLPARVAQREFIWNAVGLLNLGWLVVPYLGWKRRTTWQSAAPAYKHAGLVVGIASANMLLWALLLFGPGQTFTTHSSYADILLISVGLLGFLLVLPLLAIAIVFCLQVLNLVFIWSYGLPDAVGTLDHSLVAPVIQLPFLLVAGIIAGGLLWHFGQACLERDEKGPES